MLSIYSFYLQYCFGFFVSFFFFRYPTIYMTRLKMAHSVMGQKSHLGITQLVREYGLEGIESVNRISLRTKRTRNDILHVIESEYTNTNKVFIAVLAAEQDMQEQPHVVSSNTFWERFIKPITYQYPYTRNLSLTDTGLKKHNAIYIGKSIGVGLTTW